MKSYIAIICILLATGMLVNLDLPDGKVMVHGFKTQTVIEVEKTGMENVAMQLNVSVTNLESSSNPVGIVKIYSIQEIENLGAASNGTAISYKQPRIQWTQQENTTVSGFQIPVSAVTSAGYLEWVLYENDNPIIVGQINREEANQMVAKSASLWLIFGSLQTVGNVYTQDTYLLKQGYTYSLRLNEGNNAAENSLTVPLASTGPITINNESDLSFGYFAFTLISADVEHIQSSGISSFSYVWYPSKIGTVWVMAYYEGYSPYFLPSIDIAKTEIQSYHEFTIDFPSVSGMYGTEITLSASFFNGSLPLEGIPVEFYKKASESWVNIGTATTDAGGIASSLYQAMDTVGTYEIKVSGSYQGIYMFEYSKMNITEPFGQILVDPVTAYYNSGPINGSTYIKISGSLQNTGGDPLSSESITLFRYDGVQINQTTTDQLGKFTFVFLHNGSVGSYPAYVYLEHNSSIYTTPIKDVDIVISKGYLDFYTNQLPDYEYINETISASGILETTSGHPVDASVRLEYYNSTSSSWIPINEQTTQGGNYTFEFDNPGVGGKQYALAFDGNQLYNSLREEFIININQSKGFILREGVINQTGQQVPLGTKEDPIIVYYNHGGNFSVLLSDELNNPISNGLVKWEFIYGTTPTVVTLESVYTNQDGYAIFNWIVPSEYHEYIVTSQLSNSLMSVTVKASNENFTFAERKLYFRYVGLPLAITLTTGTTYSYSLQHQLQFSVYDTKGMPVDDGHSFRLTFLGKLYNATSSGGIVVFPVKMVQTGVLEMSIENLPQIPQLGLYYQKTTKTISITVAPTEVIVSTDTYSGYQGETIKISAQMRNLQNEVLPNVSVELWYFDTKWIKVNTSDLTSNQTGFVAYDLYLSMPTTKTYTFEWRTVEDSKYLAKSVQFSITIVKILTQLDLETPISYHFSEETSFNATLKTKLGSAISNYPVTFTMGGYKWSEVSDQNGRITSVLPVGLMPGVYTLNASFDGDLTYNGSWTSTSIEVKGVSTSVIFTVEPTKAIYGETLNFTVKLSDEFGRALDGYQLQITVAGQTYSGITDANGKYHFSSLFLVDISTAVIEIQFNSVSGYESSNTSLSIPVIKHSLNGSLSTSTLVYSDKGNIFVFVNSSNDPFVAGAFVVVEIIEGAETIFVGQGYTNETGYLVLEHAFYQPAGTLVSIQATLSHQYYYGKTLLKSFQINRETLTVEFQSGTLIYYVNGTVGITAKDNDNNVIQGLKVTISYNDGLTNIIIGEGTTDANGIYQTSFIPYSIGNYSIFFSVTDQNGNYKQFSGIAKVVVQSLSSSFSGKLTLTGAFDPAFLVSVTPELQTVPGYETNVTLLFWNSGKWDVVGSGITTNGEVVFNLSPVAILGRDSIQLKVISSSAHTVATDYSMLVEFTQLNLTASNETIELFDILFPSINVSVAEEQVYPDYYFVNIYVVVEGNSALWGSVLIVGDLYIQIIDNLFVDQFGNRASTLQDIVNMSGNYSLPENVDLISLQSAGFAPFALNATFNSGVYDMIVEVPMQGWISPTSISAKLTVEKEKLVISGTKLNLKQGETQTIQIGISDNDGTAVTGVIVELQVFMADEWQTFATGTSRIGVVSFTVTPDLPFGTFPMRYVASNQSIYQYLALETSLTISQASTLAMISLPYFTVVYSDGVNLTFLLTENGKGQPIADAMINLTVYDKNGLYISYEGATNETGYVRFVNVLDTLVPGQTYTMKVNFGGSELFSPSSVVIQITDVKKEDARIQLNEDLTVDHGPGQNQTISVIVTEDDGIVTRGIIHWIVFYKNDFGIWTPLSGYEGFIEITTSDPINFAFRLSGKHKIIIEYVDNDIYYKPVSKVEFEFGWTPSSVTAETTEFHMNFKYNTSVTLQMRFNVGSFPLRNTNVTLQTHLGNFTARTDYSGFASFTLPSLNARNYSFTVYVAENTGILQTAIPIKLTISPIEIPLSGYADDIYWNDLFELQVSDLLQEEARYNATFKIDGKVFYEMKNVDYAELTSPFLLPVDGVGNIIVSVTRYHPSALPAGFTVAFTLFPVPVDVSIQYELGNDTLLLAIVLTDARTNQLLHLPYELTLINGSQSDSFTTQYSELFIPISSKNVNITVIVILEGSHVGYASQTITHEISNAVPPNNEGFSMQAVLGQIPEDTIVIGVLIVGSSVISAVKRLRKKRS